MFLGAKVRTFPHPVDTPISDCFSRIAVSVDLLPEITRTYPKILLYIAAEMALRGEAKLVADVGEREALVAQEACQFDGGIAVNPEACCAPAELLRHLREVLWCDAEFVGIVGHVTVTAVIAPLQQVDEALHHRSRQCRNLRLPVQVGMKFIEVAKHHLRGGHHSIALKTLVRFADATDDLVEIVFAEPPIALTEVLYSDVSVHSLLSCKSLMVFRK